MADRRTERAERLTPAEKARRYRARKHADAVALSVAVPRTLEAQLVNDGYLDPAGVGDREALRQAVADFLEDVAEVGASPGNGLG